MQSDREQLLREYRDYDAKVDIVSSFEVFFQQSTSLPATVEYFERFPRYRAPDGQFVTPDFTVLFTDRTALTARSPNWHWRNEASKISCTRSVATTLWTRRRARD